MISVIIPTYKRADYIERAIDSVLNQTYIDIEVIVVDDNDSDSIDRKNMEEKMKKYADNPKVVYLKHEKNKNGAVARNTGIKASKGEYIAFLDDDDFYMPTRLEKIYNCLKENPEYSGAYTSCAIIEKKYITKIDHAKKDGDISKDILLKRMSIGTGSNLFFKADDLKSINGFDESFLRHQDLETIIRFNQKYKVKSIDEILVIKDNSDRKNNFKDINKLLEMKQNYIKSFKNVIDQFSDEEQKYFYYINYMEILYLVMKTRKFKRYKEVSDLVEKYKKINFKTKLKLVKIFFSSLLKINNISIIYKNFKYKKTIDKDLIDLIKKCN